MVLATVRRSAGSCERLPTALKTKLAQGGPSSSDHLRSDGPCDGQTGGSTYERWPRTIKGEFENNSRKPRDVFKKLAQ